jgi:hypothetical protein
MKIPSFGTRLVEPPKKVAAAIEIYAELMEEAKLRLFAISDIASGQLKMPPGFAYEFCLLQLRMLSEIIALGCLTAHGDITGANKLKKVYSASKIMDELEKLHPDFYPIPVEPTFHEGPKGRTFVMKLVKDGFTTKTELIRLAAKSSNLLHRGTIKKLISRAREKAVIDFDQVMADGQRIINLLQCHRLALHGQSGHLFCFLQGHDSSQVQVTYAPWGERL